MARYIGPVCRLCRREKTKLFLKGAKCFMSKCPIEKGRNAPGAQRFRRRKISEYGTQLREKQKLKRAYGLLEKQFHNYFKRAERQQGMTGDNLIRILERRLDNTVEKMGFTPALATARQFVRHGHILVNGRRVDYPGYQVRVGDVIEVRERGSSRQRAAESLESTSNREIPDWLKLNKNKFRGEVLRLPGEADVRLPVEISLVVGLYSK